MTHKQQHTQVIKDVEREIMGIEGDRERHMDTKKLIFQQKRLHIYNQNHKKKKKKKPNVTPLIKNFIYI